MAKPRYQQILESLTDDIVSGRYRAGQKLPSEAALVKKFDTSRITVGRAMREMQQMGMIDRVAGSGSFVRARDYGGATGPLLFGLLIPDLGDTEVFEPICRGIAGAPNAGEHALLWGHTDSSASTKAQKAWQLCQQFTSRKVSGVFFAPLEFESDADEINHKIVHALHRAEIPVVLLDRRYSVHPERRRPDLVGINNRQIGFVATEHLIQMGCKRIAFLAYHGSVATIEARTAGYREALHKHGLTPVLDEVPPEEEADEAASDLGGDIDGFVCINDRIAGQLMHTFTAKRVKVPEDVRIVGMDDAPYAALLPVPLTTVRQPSRTIGEIAMTVMLERIHRPNLPARDVLLDGDLVVRRSCGAPASKRSEK